MATQPVPLPAPYGGVNEQIPVIALQSPNCETMLNFNVTQAGIELRNGDSKYKKLSPSPAFGIYCLANYNNTSLFAAIFSNAGANHVDVYDVDAGTIAFTWAFSPTLLFSFYFNNYLFFFSPNLVGGGGPGGFTYNGTAFATPMGYEDSTGTDIKAAGGDVYKNRAYLILWNSAAYYYSPINAISGTCTTIDLSTVIAEKAILVIIAPITLADNISSVTYQAFVFSTGEILFYNGSYPDSAGWQLVGRGNIGQPLGYNSGMSYQGDYLVFCDSGVVSLRDLFLKGSEAAASLTVNSNIQDSWGDLVQAIRSLGAIPTGPITGFGFSIKGVWDFKTNRIIIAFPFAVDTGSLVASSYYFVFNTLEKAWFFHKSYGQGSGSSTSGMQEITMYKNKVLITASNSTNLMVYEKEGSTGFTDRNIDDNADTGYNYDVISAPIASGRTYVSKIQGMEVIVNSDLHAQTSYKLIRDFGVSETAAQVVSGVVSGSLQKPLVNIGIEGSFIQFQISGATVASKTVGYKLYGENIWLDQGNALR